MHDYRLQLYHFGTSTAQRAAQILSPADWWLDHGRTYEYEDLAYITIRVLSQTTSTTGCERNWSTFGLIHTKQRNRLKSARLEKLVFCHYNMRLKLKNLQLIKQVQDREKYRASGQQQAEAAASETIDIEEVFEEEHPLHAWVNATTSVEPEFDPHDRELDDVPLLPEFETPLAPKRQKKTVGARGRSKKHGISIADLETIEEDVDDETPEPSDNVVYQTSNDSTSKTSTPSEGSDHGGDVSSVPPPAPPSDPIVFSGEEDFTHATQDEHHGSRQGREAQTSSQQYARKGKKVASQFQGQGQGQGRQASKDSGYNPNFIPHRRNWLMKKKKMQEEREHQEKLRMEFETMEQASDTSSYASTEGYYQRQGGYLAYPQYPDASYYIVGGAYAQSTESDSHSHDSYGSYQGADPAPFSSARLGRARPGSTEPGSVGFTVQNSKQAGLCQKKKVQKKTQSYCMQSAQASNAAVTSKRVKQRMTISMP
ncbi:hypothetical protein Taro_011304 [Colocasia esculenta]|uniref:HAT C-terminal dimerisation domain-containing protein n=1 Tax=Colocasia esculenta TaxID=4460 RepID=A0A843U9U6_COLES|nr:hypothetical protein [Colocasia esculenta]